MYVIFIQSLNDELNQLKQDGKKCEITKKRLQELYQFGLHDSDYDEIFGKENHIYLIKDYMKFCQVIFHQSWDGSGFCYKRINQLLNKTEFIAYAGYFGAWTDNP